MKEAIYELGVHHDDTGRAWVIFYTDCELANEIKYPPYRGKKILTEEEFVYETMFWLTDWYEERGYKARFELC